MKTLTRTEEEIMKYLWKLQSAYMKDLVEEYPDPKPAYTTIATYLSRMTEKGYVGYHQRGKVREYFPKIKKSEYFKSHVNGLVKNFFNDSVSQFASFFATKSDMSLSELEDLKKLIEKQIDERKK